MALSFSGGNRSLVELHLDGDVSVGDRGAEELCAGLELNSSLKVLSLASCRLGVAGARAVAECIGNECLLYRPPRPGQAPKYAI